MLTNALRTTAALAFALAAMLAATPVHAAGGGVAVPDQNWEFEKLRGGWDVEKIRRGYTVATQVCLSCHSFQYIAHRDLMHAGLPEEEVRALASALDMRMEDPLMSPLSDEDMVSLYAKVLPDLSLMTLARAGGADYVYALLTGYKDTPPQDFDLPEGTYYNTYFPGHAISMPPPFVADGQVDYADGTEATVDQMARDITYFMAWAAEPKLFERKHTGVYVLLFLAIFVVLTYLYKKAIWRQVKK